MKMKVSTATFFVFASLVSSSAAFITTQPATFSATSSSVMFAGVELAPEPEGGEEISTIGVSLPGSRMKNMGENTELKSDVGQVFNFWMTATAQGDSIKRYRTEILKQSAKKANFPGFRVSACKDRILNTYIFHTYRSIYIYIYLWIIFRHFLQIVVINILNYFLIKHRKARFRPMLSLK